MSLDDSHALTFHKGQWTEGNKPLFGALSHGVWLGSLVFDGGRSMAGLAPDLKLHCQRIVHSANQLGYECDYDPEIFYEYAIEGIKRLGIERDYYIKPLIWCDEGFICPDINSLQFALTVWEYPLPDPKKGISACITPFERPIATMAPVASKASCHYPNSGRALQWARAKGFEQAVILDALGNIAEFASSNLFMVKDGQVKTPALNGTFLNGITRQRMIALYKEDGIIVEETRITPQELREADEIFSTGNSGKIMPCLNFEGRALQAGPLYQKARSLYMDYALGFKL